MDTFKTFLALTMVVLMVVVAIKIFPDPISIAAIIWLALLSLEVAWELGEKHGNRK